MTKEEISDLLEMNDKETLIEFIFKLQQDLDKYKRGLETARMVLSGSVSKERYESILKKYNKMNKKGERK